jgi:hypothetical protein
MNGYFIKRDRITWVWRWLVYISPHAYVTSAMMYTVFDGQTYPDYDACLVAARNTTSPKPCYGPTGSVILDGLGSTWATTDVGENVGILIAMAIFFRLLTWLLIERRVRG